MKCFLLISTLLVLVYGHPQYDYPQPSIDYRNHDIGQVGIPFPDGLEPGFIHGGRKFIQKHIYGHVPPPEFELTEMKRRPIVLPPPQKHFKIIFIKAPTPPTPNSQLIPLIPEKEEKTLVYVLVKKPDDPEDIIIPTPRPTLPSRPEVYFIRYASKKQPTGSLIRYDDIHNMGGEISDEFGNSGLYIGGRPPVSRYGPPGYNN